MSHSWIRRTLAVLIVGLTAVSVAQSQEHEKFTNLKVLPKDMPPAELHAVMNGFTRALGVRCIHCHVGTEGKPFKHEDFALDDKPTKRKARDMMRMVKDINDTYLAKLETRATPPVAVQCITCHRGTTQPRLLQDVLTTAYDTGGMDSSLARYHALRNRYYGRFAYDFGEVPLADVATKLRNTGHAADASRMLALNVEMNPNSAFAKRQFANASIAAGFRTAPDSGVAAYREFRARYGDTVINEELLNDVGYQLLHDDPKTPALEAFKLNVAENPTSGNAYDSLGEAYVEAGDLKAAQEAYKKSLALDPTNDNAKHQLDEIKTKSKQKKGATKKTS